MRCLAAADPGVLLLCLIDGNCRLGQARALSVGPSGGQAECTGGQCFHHHILVKLGLWLPSTFGSSSPTWQGTTGKRCRIDYVAIPLAWSQSLLAEGILPEDTLALEDKLDHLAPFVEVQLQDATPGLDHQPR